ncbi:Endoplasmic reticulum resident protein 29-like protein, partial [Leptotrombidium deliense]
VLSRVPVTLVKFDIQFPYANNEDEYAQVADSLKNKENLLVAEVGVQDYADYENQDLAGRYSLNRGDFPVVKLYTHDNLKSPATFPTNEKFTASNIMRFVK